MKISVFLTLLLTQLASPLNGKTLKPLIVDGENAERNEIPFLVEIWWSQYDLRFLCSGVILSEGLILTTARCAHDYWFENPTPARALHVVAGDPVGNRDEESGLLRSVKRVIVHPGWNKNSDTFANDVAIFVLENELELIPGKIEIAPFPESLEESGVNAGDSGLVTGWGNIVEESFDETPIYSEILQKVDLSVASDENCRGKFELLIPEQQFCAGSVSGSVCNGDQGSPFIVSDGADPPTLTVLGLVSNIKDCSNDATGALFTKLGPHLGWIAEQMDIATTTTEIPSTVTTEEPTTPEKSTRGTSTDAPPSTELPSENPLPTSTENSGDATNSPLPTTTNNGFSSQSVWIFTISCSLLLLITN